MLVSPEHPVTAGGVAPVLWSRPVFSCVEWLCPLVSRNSQLAARVHRVSSTPGSEIRFNVRERQRRMMTESPFPEVDDESPRRIQQFSDQ
eukprot:2802115-Rhodomonas_salina.1